MVFNNNNIQAIVINTKLKIIVFFKHKKDKYLY